MDRTGCHVENTVTTRIFLYALNVQNIHMANEMASCMAAAGMITVGCDCLGGDLQAQGGL